MKKYIILAVIAIAALAGCRNTYQTLSAGKDNASFVLITTDNDEYRENVSVVIDNNQPILIEKVFKTKKQLQAKPIETTPGKHTIKVLKGDKVLFNEFVFLGLQETKKIILK
jgi:hypothetical protein